MGRFSKKDVPLLLGASFALFVLFVRITAPWVTWAHIGGVVVAGFCPLGFFLMLDSIAGEDRTYAKKQHTIGLALFLAAGFVTIVLISRSGLDGSNQ